MAHLASISWRSAPVWVLCSFLVVILVAVRPQPGDTRSPAEGPQQGGRIVLGLQQEPERLCELLHLTATNNLLGNLLNGRFVKYTPDFDLVPDLIEEIPTVANGGITADMLTYTYKLRDGVRWHDGTPLTSADVKFTVDVIMDERHNVEARSGWELIEAIELPDERTVVFKLAEPYPDFVGDTFNDEAVLPKHVLEAHVGEAFGAASFHRAPVGTGPYKLTEWKSGSHMTFARNDDYHGEGPYLDEIIVKFVPDDNALLVQLQAGEIDIYDNANTSFVPQVKRLRGVAVYPTPSLMYEHLDFNTEHAILSDKRVRQALGFATDKKLIAEKVYGGFAEVAALDEHPASNFYSADAAARTQHNTLQARRLLRDAGWTDTNGDGVLDKNGQSLRLEISATAGNPNRERTEVVLQEMYRDLGIELTIRNYSPQVLYGGYDDGGILKNGKFEIAMYAFLSSPEPASKQGLYSSNSIPPNGQNHPRIRHDRLTELLAAGASEVDPADRVRIYHEVSDILVEEAPVVPLFWYTTVDFCSERLRNYRPNPTSSADTWNANLWHIGDEVAHRR